MTGWDRWLDRAARIAWRGHGGAEPNPMVGCVILDRDGQPVAEGHHRRCGGPHAEVEALRHAGERARGGTAIVTLEPCNHHGRTGPCSQALLRAGIARVVFACPDPNPAAAGGANTLRDAGVEVVQVDHRGARAVTEPFVVRRATGRPWVIAKWAESADGRMVTPPGQTKWISGERSRAMVHRERGRVDAVLTGMGTVLADDPLLTVRGTTPRRTPMRVVWDPRLGMPTGSALVRTARDVPLLVACTPSAWAAHTPRAEELRSLGARVEPHADPGELLQSLGARGASTVLVEAGPALTGQLLRAGLVDIAWVFTAPHHLGPGGTHEQAPVDACARAAWPIEWSGLRGRDRVTIYRVPR
jgi:diaminohydroxyphosphoribosylaminopyrimidine deaminase/5-amino-6-(5-phosphoribosylamino)uracil reductase